VEDELVFDALGLKDERLPGFVGLFMREAKNSLFFLLRTTISNNKDLDVCDASGTRVLRRTTNSSGTTMTVYAFGLEEHTYFNAGAHKGDLYYYSLGGRLLGSLDNTGKTMFDLTDALGSVLASFSNVAQHAAIQGNQVFGPYGNFRDVQGSINTTKGFTGQYNDSVSGLDYYGSRYYDPVAGVFLSADVKQGNMQGKNPYGYVGGNPETNSDPSGQFYAPPPPITTQPPVTSNPLTWPKLEIPPEAPVEACVILCPSLGIEFGIAFILAVGLTLATPDLLDPGVYPLPVITAPFRSRSSAVVYGSNGPTQLTFQPHSNPPQTQTGSGGQGVIPPLPMAAAGDFCSFTPDTPVTTNHGKQVISKLHVNDKVLAYNPKTHKMELQPILHVWTHTDHDLIDLTIMATTGSHHGRSAPSRSEVVHTTSEHPFLTTEQSFVSAGKVKDGMHILRADGSVGVVTSKKVVPGIKVMYNLEVAHDHTFIVGDEQWIVHNECNRGRLRNNLGLRPGDPFQAHHVIPCECEGHELIQAAGDLFDRIGL
jgi:RHS repeat-associated protein